MPGRAQAEIERRELAGEVQLAAHEYMAAFDEKDVAREQFRAARDALVEAIVTMLKAGMTIDDLMDECGVPRGGMRSALRAMIGRYDTDALIAALDAQKAS